MRRVHSSHISSGAADVLRRVLTPTDDGWWDLSSIYFEPNRQDLRSPYLCNGDKRVAVSTHELYKAVTYLPRFMAPENCNNVGWIVLMQEHAQVFWKGSGICLFEDVEKRHLEVLRTVQESMSYPAQRDEIGVSFTDTILALSDLYGCRDEHKRTCPAAGDRTRSLIAASGDVNTTLLKKLRDLGASHPMHRLKRCRSRDRFATCECTERGERVRASIRQVQPEPDRSRKRSNSQRE